MTHNSRVMTQHSCLHIMWRGVSAEMAAMEMQTPPRITVAGLQEPSGDIYMGNMPIAPVLYSCGFARSNFMLNDHVLHCPDGS